MLVMGMTNFMIEIIFMMRKAGFVTKVKCMMMTLFNLILKCNQTLTKHSLSKDRTQGKEGHDGAEVQVKDEEDKVHYGDHVRDEDEQVRDGGPVCDHGEDLILCGIVVNLCSFSSKPRSPKRLVSPFCKIKHDQSLFSHQL